MYNIDQERTNEPADAPGQHDRASRGRPARTCTDLKDTLVKLVIFGANGPVGRLLTQQALDAGHLVIVVTRHPDAFPIGHAQLQILAGDVLAAADVARAIEGQEAVLSLYGVPYTFKPVTVYSAGMANILPAMRAAGVRRLVCVTSSGTSPGYDAAEGFVFGRVIKPLLGRTLYADMRRMEALVIHSDRDWTIVRPGLLVNASAVTPYRVAEGYRIPGTHKTARADLADFLLKQAASARYRHKAVAVGTLA
jgi:nucleoside-diphosphate-sugar epimerase